MYDIGEHSADHHVCYWEGYVARGYGIIYMAGWWRWRERAVPGTLVVVVVGGCWEFMRASRVGD